MPPFVGVEVEAVEGDTFVSYGPDLRLHLNGDPPSPPRGGFDVLRCMSVASGQAFAKAECDDGTCIACSPAQPCSPTKPPPPGVPPGANMAIEVRSAHSFPTPTTLSFGSSELVTLPYTAATSHAEYVAMLQDVYGGQPGLISFHLYRVFQSSPTLPPHPLHDKVIAIPVKVTPS